MSKVISDGETRIGAYNLPKRKKPCLCIEKGNVLTVYGTFINTKAAEKFMDELAVFIVKGGAV